MNKGNNRGKEAPIPRPSEKRKTRETAFAAGSGPSPLHSSSGGLLLVVMCLTLVLPEKSKTASVAISLHSHLSEGAFGCSHPHAFPISFHNLVIWGRKAPHSVNWWRRVCCLYCLSSRGRSPHVRIGAGNAGWRSTFALGGGPSLNALPPGGPVASLRSDMGSTGWSSGTWHLWPPSSCEKAGLPPVLVRDRAVGPCPLGCGLRVPVCLVALNAMIGRDPADGGLIIA